MDERRGLERLPGLLRFSLAAASLRSSSYTSGKSRSDANRSPWEAAERICVNSSIGGRPGSIQPQARGPDF